MKTATFYHTSCTVCVAAEQEFVGSLDPAQYPVEVVHLGETPNRIAEAETAGVKSVPVMASEPCRRFSLMISTLAGAIVYLR